MHCWVNIEKSIFPWEILLLEVNICLSYEIALFPRYRAKYLTQWISIINLVSLMGVLLQVRFKIRKDVGEIFFILYQIKFPMIVVYKSVPAIA